jgi:ribosomal protein L11 methyltransferase
MEVVDYGCGSGVLAIAALKLGARRAYAYDIDPQALLATAQNAADNEVEDRLTICEDAAQIPPGRDLLLANILADTLIELRHELTRRLAERRTLHTEWHSGRAGSASDPGVCAGV